MKRLPHNTIWVSLCRAGKMAVYCEINVRQIIIIANGINFKQPKLQTALARVLDKLERNQKKGKSSTYNFQDDGHISSCPVVHV